MKGFKIAFIICFALSGFFFLTGCIFPPLFVMFVFTLAGGIVFSSIYRKTSQNRSEEIHAAEAVEPEAVSAVEAVETVTAVEAVEAVEAAPVAAGWTCSCGTVVTDGNFCPSCGAAKTASEAPVAAEAAEATDAAPCEAPIPTSSVNEQGFEVIDLSQYPVHEEKIEYDPSNTKHKFVHATGFVGSIPQKFVDHKMTKCPYCCKKPLLWEFTQIRLKTWRGNINVFRCSECEGTYSISVMDISTALDLAAGYATGLNLVNMAAKKKAGKEAHTAYVTFENVGKSGVCPSIQGKEVRLQDAQAISNRR